LNGDTLKTTFSRMEKGARVYRNREIMQ